MFTKAALAASVAFGVATAPAFTQNLDTRPNILLVLLDDAGFTEFGSYGSDTKTPVIDALSQSGAQFSSFYATPLCGPSRAMLLTGQSNHEVGSGTLAEVLTDEMRALPAYDMTWDDDQETIGTRLQEAGYQTFVSGKWGIGDIGVNLPDRFGFDRSWVLDATGASNYVAKPYLPLYKEVKWFEDGERVDLPEDFYSSRDIVDKMITYMDEADPDQPFFGYLSFMAVHLPVQVPLEYVEKYNGVFDEGWDALRETRLERVKELGLVAETTELPDPAAGHRPWESLSESEKAYWARVMQVNAGMMEAADFHLGRLIDHLEAKGELDNTIVLVMSDNGPEYNTLGKTAPPAMRAFERTWMGIEGWDVSFDNLGQPGSIAGIGPEWASVSAAPFDLFKFSASEGGVRVPFIISGPGIDPIGITHARSQMMDIMPTLLDLVDVPFETDEFRGRSLAPVLEGVAETIRDEDDVIGIEVSGTVGLYRGDWKLTRTPEPFDDGTWKLYNIISNPGETNDLSAADPELKAELIAEYEAYANEVGVYVMPEGRTARQQLNVNAIKKTMVNYWYLPLALLTIVIGVLYGIYRLIRGIFRRGAAA